MSPISVYQQLIQSTEHFANNPLLHFPAAAIGTARDFDASYAQVLASSDELKALYASTGLKVGDRVAILLENRPQFFFHWFALNALGVCVVPVNGELMVEEAGYLISNSDARCVVGLEHSLDYLNTVIDHAKLDIPVVTDTNIETLKIQNDDKLVQEISLNTECAILYTSGSTGKPKGCLLSNDYFLLSGAKYRDAGGYCKLEMGKERLITPLPLVHMNAMACSSMGMMMSGGCLIQIDRFHPRSWWQTVRESGATIIHYLGVMPAILLKLPAEDDDFSNQVKFGYGAGVNPVHHGVFEERFGFPLIESWGMTETGNANCIGAFEEPRHVGTSCIGKQPETVDIKLIDEAGVEVSKGEPGELLVRAKGQDPRKGFFSGYYKNQAATDEAWEGGWLHTGDIIRQGKDGSFHFVDRLKNVIRRSGENISALEVEATLSLCEEVGQVGVAAVPDEIRGDEVMACVVVSEGVRPSQATAESIFNTAKKSLAYFKLPAYISFVSELPLTASNKPQRAELKKLARETVAAFHSSESDVENSNSNLRDTKNACFDLRSLKKK